MLWETKANGRRMCLIETPNSLAFFKIHWVETGCALLPSLKLQCIVHLHLYVSKAFTLPCSFKILYCTFQPMTSVWSCYRSATILRVLPRQNDLLVQNILKSPALNCVSESSFYFNCQPHNDDRLHQPVRSGLHGDPEYTEVRKPST